LKAAGASSSEVEVEVEVVSDAADVLA